MSAVLALSAKLQIREGQKVALINPPPGFDLDALTADGPADAMLLFVRNRDELEALGEPLFDAARDDRLAWLAYPKAGQLGTDQSRAAAGYQDPAAGLHWRRQGCLDPEQARLHVVVPYAREAVPVAHAAPGF